MGLLKDELFACLDCESTGLNSQNDRIIEIACVIFTFDRIIDTFETLINPEIPIPEASQKIHNISEQMVRGKPTIEKVLPKLLEFLNHHIVVGHGISFDLDLIAQAANRYGICFQKRNSRCIDTLRLARLYGESPINSLEKLRQHFNIAAIGSHRAMSDVMVNIEVFKYLVKSFKTTEEIMQKLEKPIQLKIMPLGKHKGRRFEEIPLEYLLWAQKKDFDQDLLFSIQKEIKSRKSKNNFEQASNPFSSL